MSKPRLVRIRPRNFRHRRFQSSFARVVIATCAVGAVTLLVHARTTRADATEPLVAALASAPAPAPVSSFVSALAPAPAPFSAQTQIASAIVGELAVAMLAAPIAEPVPPREVRVVRRVRKGDTLGVIMNNVGIPPEQAHAVFSALRGVYNPRRIFPGQRLTLSYRPGEDNSEDDRILLNSLNITTSVKRGVLVSRGRNDGFAAKKVENHLERRLVRARGTINSSLYKAGEAAALPRPILLRLIGIYSWDVDFQREIYPGDSFDVVFERLYTEDGELVGVGEIIYSELKLQGVAHKLYRHRYAKGRTDYFDQKGQSARKPLMRTPIDGGRLTSGYGLRRHPISGYTRMHRGVDFGARRGTPVYAAGNGRIAYIGRKGAYGRYLRIRHNSHYVTAYGHLRGFRRGLKNGSRVKQGQVVGYVGSTGRATGPHLHYEVHVNGRLVNPLRVKLPSGRVLRGKQMAAFRDTRQAIERQVAAIPSTVKVSSR